MCRTNQESEMGCAQVPGDCYPLYSVLTFAFPAIRVGPAGNRDLVNACPSNEGMSVRRTGLKLPRRQFMGRIETGSDTAPGL